MEIILIAGLTCLIGGLYESFYNKYLTRKLNSDILTYLLWTAIIFNIYIMSIRFNNGKYIIYLATVIGNLLMGSLFYYRQKFYNIYLSLIVGLVSIFSMIFAKNILNYFLIDEILKQILIIILSTILMGIIFSIIKKFIKKKDEYMDEKAVVVIMEVFIITVIAYITQLLEEQFYLIGIVGIILSSLVFILISYFYYKSLEYNEIVEEKSAVKSRILIYRDYISDYEAMESHRIKIREDIISNMNNIKKLFNEDKKEELEEYIDNLKLDNNIYGDILTNNFNMNALFNNYKWKLNYYGIKLDYEIKVPQNIDLEYKDINIIICNLMENAINHGKKVEKKDKSILLSVKYMEDFLRINIKSPYEKFEVNNYEINTVKILTNTYKGKLVISEKEDLDINIIMKL